MYHKFLLSLIVTLALLGISRVGFAQVVNDSVKCVPFDDLQLAIPEPNIEQTVTSSALSGSTVLTYPLTGNNACDSIATATKCVQDGSLLRGDLDACKLSPVGSSNSTLLGTTGTLRAMANSNDTIPINFAYYVRDQVKHVPVVGNKVYAQGVYEGIFGLELSLALWKIFRNMALGLMSIFLIVIGIMIIMRKKVDPRTVLTLQAALPRVIISMVLIVFSFAIGALFIRFIPAGRYMSDAIFDSVVADIPIESGTATEHIFAIMALAGVGVLTGILAGPGIAIGALAMFVGPIFLLVWLCILFAVYIKTLIIYVKMLFNTITAPFQFAFGALPGQDAQITNWFKKMTAYLLSIPAMYFMVSLAEFVQLYALRTTLFGYDLQGYSGTFVANIVQTSVQQLFLLLVAPFISIILLVQALTIPRKIEQLILGPPPKR